MLVLSRKVGEEIVIAGSIRVKVLAVRGNQIRLGFTAPPEVEIQREELTGRPGSVPPRARDLVPVPDLVVHADHVSI